MNIVVIVVSTALLIWLVVLIKNFVLDILHNEDVIFWHRNLLRMEGEGTIDRDTVNKEWDRYGKIKAGPLQKNEGSR
jgi:hypothetical protein